MKRVKLFSLVGLTTLLVLGTIGCGSNNSSKASSTTPDNEILETTKDDDAKLETSQEVITPQEDAGISEKVTESKDETSDAPTTEETSSSDVLRPEFVDALKGYEDFFDEYCTFMEKYNSSDDVMGLLSDYTNYITKYTETMEKIEALKDQQLSDAELKHYTEVMTRINSKILEVAVKQ